MTPFAQALSTCASYEDFAEALARWNRMTWALDFSEGLRPSSAQEHGARGRAPGLHQGPRPRPVSPPALGRGPAVPLSSVGVAPARVTSPGATHPVSREVPSTGPSQEPPPPSSRYLALAGVRTDDREGLVQPKRRTR